MSVLGIRRFVEPSPRTAEGLVGLRIYSTERRRVRRSPQDKNAPRAASTAEGLTAKEPRDARQHD